LHLARRDEQQRMKELEDTHKILLSYRNKFEDRKERSEKYWLKICELKQLHSEIHDLNVKIQELELDNHQKEDTINKLLMNNNDYEDEIRHMRTEIRSYAHTVFALERVFTDNHEGTYEAFRKHLESFAELTAENFGLPRMSDDDDHIPAYDETKLNPSTLIFMRDDESRPMAMSSSFRATTKTPHHTPVTGVSEDESVRIIPDARAPLKGYYSSPSGSSTRSTVESDEIVGNSSGSSHSPTQLVTLEEPKPAPTAVATKKGKAEKQGKKVSTML
jgi:hypothetical protein